MPTAHSKAMWQCKWHNLVANFGTNACDVLTKFWTSLNKWENTWTNAHNATWWPKLELIQVTSPGGQIWNQYKWRHLQIDFCQKNDLGYRVNTLGPLCLWQCFLCIILFQRKWKWLCIIFFVHYIISKKVKVTVLNGCLFCNFVHPVKECYSGLRPPIYHTEIITCSWRRFLCSENRPQWF